MEKMNKNKKLKQCIVKNCKADITVIVSANKSLTEEIPKEVFLCEKHYDAYILNKN